MYSLLILLGLLSCVGCEKDNPSPNNGSTHLELTILGSEERQTIRSFGASDAWSCQFIGKNWPESKKQQIADLLFSTELDENQNPMGIGLSAWRFNIGAGSAEQGANSDINDEWRRAESFMVNNNEYDWTKQEGQRWFLKAAKQRGVSQFIGFVNSPPVALTKNGKAYSSNNSSYNLPADNYTLFADYLSEVVSNISQNEGITFDYISPFNEPQWDWTGGGQEGTPAQNSEIAAVCREIDQAFTSKNISSKIEIPESGQLNYLYENDNKTGRGQQINSFFNPSSSEYIGNLSHMAKKVAGHSYYTTWPLSRLEETRVNLKNEITNISEPLEFWMSEYCVLENNSEINGSGRDLTMKTALYVARVIYSDLVLANASSWQWWLAVSPYNYKDGLVYIDHNKFDGQIYDSKLLWSLGNFSRFIKPGMKRVAISRNNGKSEGQALDGIMASAYVNSSHSTVSIVLINYKETKIPAKIKMENLAGISNLKYYLTDGKNENNLSFQGEYIPGELIEIPPRSVLTITNQE